VPITMAKLFYYKSEQSASLSGYIEVKDIISVGDDDVSEPDPEKPDQRIRLFKIITNQRIFMLAAESATDRSGWVSAKALLCIFNMCL